MAIDPEQREEEEQSVSELLRDRFRLGTISIAEAEAKQIGMQVSPQVVACISDCAFKHAQQLAADLELFAQHAGRKSVKMDDVLLSAHRNEHLTAILRTLCDDLKAKEPQTERDKKRKRNPKKEDPLAPDVVDII